MKLYRKYNNGEISALQFFVFIINIIVGTGILNLSREVAEVSKQDAWISVLFSGIFISFIVIIIIFTVSKFPKHNFLKYTSYLLSKPLGYFITFSYIIYSVLFTGIVIAYICEMTATWLLNETPIYIIRLILVLTIVYMIRNGLTSLARFAQITIFFLIPFTLLIFVGLPEIHLINLRPIGGSGVVNIMKGVLPSFFTFAGYETLLVYYPYISDKQKPIMRNSVLAILVVTLIYTLTVMAEIALFGPEEILTVLYPSINYLTSVNTPIIERSEIFFTTFWIFTALTSAGIQYFTSSVLLQNIFNTKKTSVFTYALAPIVFFISISPRNTTVVAKLVGKIGNASIFFGFLLPIILFIMYLIKGKDKNNEKDN